MNIINSILIFLYSSSTLAAQLELHPYFQVGAKKSTYPLNYQTENKINILDEINIGTKITYLINDDRLNLEVDAKYSADKFSPTITDFTYSRELNNETSIVLGALKSDNFFYSSVNKIGNFYYPWINLPESIYGHYKIDQIYGIRLTKNQVFDAGYLLKNSFSFGEFKNDSFECDSCYVNGSLLENYKIKNVGKNFFSYKMEFESGNLNFYGLVQSFQDKTYVSRQSLDTSNRISTVKQNYYIGRAQSYVLGFKYGSDFLLSTELRSLNGETNNLKKIVSGYTLIGYSFNKLLVFTSYSNVFKINSSLIDKRTEDLVWGINYFINNFKTLKFEIDRSVYRDENINNISHRKSEEIYSFAANFSMVI